MARIYWYLFGDIDCYMRGGLTGTNTELADELASLPNDGQHLLDNTGSPTAPPGLADLVSTLVQAAPNRNPNVPAWLPSDWPNEWHVNIMEATQTTVDELVIQPHVVSVKWPPNGGAGLNVNVSGLQPDLSDSNTIRYGDLLLQTIDKLVTTPDGRQTVVNAANGGPINAVDLVALIKKEEPQLASGPAALPSSFTATFQEVRQTTKTYFDVNAQGGVHLVLGWKEVPVPSPEERERAELERREMQQQEAEQVEVTPVVFLARYPCGGFSGALPDA